MRVDDRLIAAIAAVSGVIAALSDASPTGAATPDAILLVLAAGVVTWASASAPWWASASAAGIGAVLALDGSVAVAAVGAAACAGGLWIGTQLRDQATLRAVVGGAAVNVLCRMQYDGFSGATALIGIGLGVMLLVTGVQRRQRSVRRAVVWSSAAVVGVSALAGIVVGLAGLSVRSDVVAGRQLVAEGVDLLRDGEYVEAAFRFDAAASTFDAAQVALSRPWAQPARLVPIVAQNRAAVDQVAGAAADASSELANASLLIDLDDLRTDEGQFDLDEIAAIEPSVAAAYESLVALRAVIDGVDSPWLFGSVQEPLDAAAEEFDDNIDRFDTAVQALQRAPDLLGADRPRNYFVAFTTPAEARGLGGFMGNFAVLTADDGEITMSQFGRTKELNDEISTADGTRRVTGPQDWLDRWGRFGFTSGPDGTTGDVPWSNITVSPHFPSTAAVIAELFPQSGGRRVDGVFALDPYVVEALVGFTGPVSVEGVDQRLTKDNTAEFLLFDQYLLDDTEQRIDLLEAVANEVFDEFFSGGLPNPSKLADQLGPLIDQRRLVGWAVDPAEQTLFDRIGLTGALPDITADGFQLVVNNAAANKLDAWLGRDISYRAEFDPATRAVVGRIEATLTNEGPSTGLPDGVIGNYIDEPPGTSRSLVTLYTAFPGISATLDGEPVDFEPGVEAGWHTASLYLTLPSGDSSRLVMTVAGVVDSPVEFATTDVYELVIATQPLVVPATYDIEISGPARQVLVAMEGEGSGVQRLAHKPPLFP